jgi:phosphotransferase system HPr (HPr) family protein
MSGGTLRQSVVIHNPQGFHMRPKAAVAQQAQKCQCDVRLHWNGRSFDGKSMLDLMLLAAEQGQEVIFETDGPDAREALPALIDALRQFEDEEAAGQAPTPLPNS